MINIIFNYIFGLIFQSPFWALESKSEYENNIYHLDFFYYFSCYIKVSDGQHNNISLFKIDWSLLNRVLGVFSCWRAYVLGVFACLRAGVLVYACFAYVLPIMCAWRVYH